MLRKKSSGNIKKPAKIDKSDPSQYRQKLARQINSLPKQLQEQLLWVYEYPVIDDKVTNPAVEEFVNGVTYLLEAKKNGAYCDFNERGTKLNFRSVTCGEDNLIPTLENFLAPSDSYSEAERTAVAKFIASRGGQDFNFLTQLLVKYNHFMPAHLRGQASLHQEDHSQNWTLGKNGKATFNWESDYLSLTANCTRHEEACAIAKDENSNVDHFSMSRLDGPLSMEEFNRINKQPLLRIKYEVQLEVINEKVLPVVTNLTVMNFTPGLVSPEDRLINNKDEQQKHIFSCMQHIDNILEEKGYDYNSPEYRALEIIRRMLKQSNGGQDMQALHFAMNYIESLNMQVTERSGFNLFGTKRDKCLADIWRDDSRFNVMFTSASAGKPYKPVAHPHEVGPLIKLLAKMGEGVTASIADEDFKFQIGSIYLNLCKFKTKYQPFTYLDFEKENGYIRGIFVIEWQERVEKAQRNFRDSKGEEIIDESVVNFLNTHGIYTPEELSVVKTWMKTKPMESVSSLLQYMFASHMFEIAGTPEGTLCGLNQSRISQALWHFDNDGRIKLSLTYDIDAITATNPLNNDSMRLIRDVNKDSLALSREKSQTPIARVHAEIALDVDDNLKVIPNVTKLDVSSYTKDFNLSNEATLKYTNSTNNELGYTGDKHDLGSKF